MNYFHPLTAIGMSMAKEMKADISEDNQKYLESVLFSFIQGRIPQKDATNAFLSIIGSDLPIVRISQVLSVSSAPISDFYGSNQDIFFSIKKSRPWSTNEDMRLLAGINKYGLKSWGSVAKFVGNSRTKAQCAQRWARGLDPRIAKEHWSHEEDQKLLQNVKKYGEKSWRLISNEIKSRSDVQCRYRYNQIMNSKKKKSERKAYINSAEKQPAQPPNFVQAPIPAQSLTQGKVVLPPICTFDL